MPRPRSSPVAAWARSTGRPTPSWSGRSRSSCSPTTTRARRTPERASDERRSPPLDSRLRRTSSNVFDVAEHRGRPLIVMEYLEGGSVYERMRRRADSARDGARLARAGCGGDRPGARERRRPPGREAGEPPPRRRGQRSCLRLRHRVDQRGRRTHGARHRARDGRLPRAGAGSRRAGERRERSLRARRRRVRAPDRTQAVRGRHPGHRGLRAPERRRPARDAVRPDAADGGRRCVPVALAKEPQREARKCPGARPSACGRRSQTEDIASAPTVVDAGAPHVLSSIARAARAGRSSHSARPACWLWASSSPPSLAPETSPAATPHAASRPRMPPLRRRAPRRPQRPTVLR